MTHRRDKDVVNDGIVKGLRMEPQLAQLICEGARQHASRIVHRTPKGDVAEYTRYLLRRGLGWTHEVANALEDTALKPRRLAAMAIEAEVYTRLRGYAAQGFTGNIAAAARHLLRIGLRVPEEESLRREARFAEIAAIKKEIMEAG